MEVKKIAVIGGSGQMGQGICHVAALGGYEVSLRGRTPETCQKAFDGISKNMFKGVEKGKVSKEEAEAALARIKTTTSLEECAKDADFVIEAVPEELKVKWETFQALDEICPGHTVFATNTSSLSITEIFSVTKRTDRCIGMHFFIPVHIMRLVEIIKGLETSDETAAVTEAVAKKMGKETVMVNEAPGFATSRINALIGNEAFRMLQEGVASAEDIDKAIKLGLNHPMGPFEMIDMVGLDTRLHTLEYLYETLGERFRPNPLHVKYVKAGRLGRKVGKGVYEYPDLKK
ncbi:MAG: 3-hydroxyacyl-CoA dehydrogenase NAD-binding domain-containing protein [Peptococcaceae bacterium]|jgi:3-hydroxybutyryl-CoA dehydrogenase|nr:3-hydroxyacyl-CoA dehydrogenase NAD-binding domain-containing protein [Peptococcaceae bacterium]MDH7524375.1 3-hydroxyacyl-CoA dehydrogenase NAD-binding domain-containing protein [Peptococcaceae bacterium]